MQKKKISRKPPTLSRRVACCRFEMIAYGIVVFKNIFYELKFLFQINWIFKIYKGVMQKKNVNVNKKNVKISTLPKNITNSSKQDIDYKVSVC